MALQGKIDSAIKAYQKTLEIQPDNEDAIFVLSSKLKSTPSV